MRATVAIRRLSTKSSLRQHVRACQVTDEIITLLENGFADGAMARWRTLHEIAVVTSLISQHGIELAERYVAYQAVEAKRALDMYARCHTDLGYRSEEHTSELQS